MKEKLTYVVLGSGGTGGPIGGFLAKAGLDVTMIARGRHLEAMRAPGRRWSGSAGCKLQNVRI